MSQALPEQKNGARHFIAVALVGLFVFASDICLHNLLVNLFANLLENKLNKNVTFGHVF